MTPPAMGDQERWYAEHLPLRDQVVADVGANVGRFSQFFWDTSGGTSHVVSIEPLAENVAAIRERIRAANTDKWTVEACAVSAHQGSVGLAVQRMPEGGWNSVITSKAPARTVPCRPLSRIVPGATVVKIDIEGGEYGVLEEALPRLQRVRAWALELHRVPGRPLQAVLGALMAHGFRVYAAAKAAGGAGWASAEIPVTLDWSQIPAAKVRADGSEFKMLHVLALRDAGTA